MGSLTSYLQGEFVRHCPPGWTSRREVHILPEHLERLLGYAPRVDVVLEKQDGSTCLWIEFEISRADPVANHAKFATSHIFQPQRSIDIFIAMLSPHVALGRRNLAANTIQLMRHIGMRAFQTVLFPFMTGEDVKRLNHLRKDAIQAEYIDVEAEIERALSISEPILELRRQGIYFVGDILEVMLNIHSWNRAMATEYGQRLWGKHTCCMK